MGFGRALVGVLATFVAAQAQSGIISTIAGIGSRGYSGDGGPAVRAQIALANFTNRCDPNTLEQMSHIAVDSGGNVYFTDSDNQRVRRIDPSGTITTIAGNGAAPAANGQCLFTGPVADGPAGSAQLFNPAGIAVRNGDIYIADEQNNRIRRITSAATISTIGGVGLHNLYAPGIPATSSPMDWPAGLALDSAGVVYFSELHSNRVGRIVNGVFNTVAGSGFPGATGDGGLATTARLNKPAGIAFEASGALLIADSSNHSIRRVGTDGNITRLPVDGLKNPLDVKVDTLGNIYIADTGNHRVLRMDSSGAVTTVAGTGQPDRGPDGVAANTSALNFPCGLAVDANNDLYIVDWQNYLIRKVSFGAVPVIATGGVVSGASFDDPVAPGSLISIFGSNLGGDGVRVEVNGTAIPTTLVTAGQINAQLPYETAPGTAAAVVSTPAGRSASVPFPVAAAAPGAFTFAGTDRAIVANADGSLNGPESPIDRGGVLVFYVTGLGAVSPPVATGQPAPLDPLSFATAAVTASIGGAPATVLFAGLTPGFIGLGQINVLVPSTAATGSAVPVVFEAAGQKSKTVTVSVR